MKTVIFTRSTEIYNDSRATKTIRILTEAGYKVIVLGWNRTGNAKQKCDEVFTNMDIKCLFFSKIFTFGGVNGGFFRKIKIVLSFNKWLKKQLKLFARQAFAIHSCDLDTGWVAYKAAKKYKIKLIYDVYDYYVDTRVLPALLSTILEKREIKTINFACVTILCTEQRIAQISKAKPKRVVYLHNTPELPKFDVTEKDDVDDKTTIVFIGSLSEDRLLAEIAEKIPHKESVELIIGGYGKYSELYKEMSEKHENIIYVGSQSFNNTLMIENKCNILFACYNPEIKNHKFSAPNKVYHAMAMSKPVIVCRGTGIDELVLQENFGLVIDYDPDSFFSAIEQLKEFKTRKKMGEHGNALYHKSYSFDIMKNRLLEIYKVINQ